MTLTIYDAGDWSVGIPSEHFEIDVPFYFPDVNKIDAYDKELLREFKESMLKLYQDYCEGRLSAWYDFENDEMEREEAKIDEIVDDARIDMVQYANDLLAMPLKSKAKKGKK